MNLRKSLLLLTIFLFCFFTVEFPTYASTQFIYNSEIVPYADVSEWRYKVENNKLYRRLYNKTKQVWVGDWELCS